ncbi:MAG: response regulator transcription factor [Dehalococcoidia bacterium]|nr:response regulator transcription factor [Dehalococcoidia bacterium]
MHHILIVGRPGEELSRLVSELGRNGFDCATANTADGMLAQCNKQPPDLLLVETGSIPDVDQLCRILHEEKDTPVLALTSLDMALNLDGTADDFVARPLNAREVVTRAKRLLHKHGRAGKSEQIKVGNLVIDTAEYEVYVDGRPISLTYKEYELLRFLATHPGRVFTRDTLLNRVWGDDYFGGDRTVDVHIRRLRGKIEDQTHIYIETVRNIGYRFIKQDR